MKISEEIYNNYTKLGFQNFGYCFVNYLGKYDTLKPIVRSNPFIKDFQLPNACESSSDYAHIK